MRKLIAPVLVFVTCVVPLMAQNSIVRSPEGSSATWSISFGGSLTSGNNFRRIYSAAGADLRVRWQGRQRMRVLGNAFGPATYWMIPNDARLLGTRFHAQWTFLACSQTTPGIHRVIVDGLCTPSVPSRSL